jgi:hypothetical protein
MSLPSHERPKQRPMLKTEESGNVILASYPDLRSPSPTYPTVPSSPPKSGEAAVHKGILRNKTKISISVGIVTVIVVVLVSALFNQQMLTKEKYTLYEQDSRWCNYRFICSF